MVTLSHCGPTAFTSAGELCWTRHRKTVSLCPTSSECLKMNHFQWLNKVNELKIFFFAQRANTWKQASSRRLLPYAMPWRQQSRTAWARGARIGLVSASHSRHVSAEDQDLYNRTSLTSWAHLGSLSKWRELVLSSLPTCPAPFLPILGPRSLKVSKVVCLISLYLLSTCMYHTFSYITFLGNKHIHSRASVFLDSLLSEHIIRCHMCPWGRLLPGYNTEGLLLSGQGGCSRRPYRG